MKKRKRIAIKVCEVTKSGVVFLVRSCEKQKIQYANKRSNSTSQC